jgi:hypothetical protein
VSVRGLVRLFVAGGLLAGLVVLLRNLLEGREGQPGIAESASREQLYEQAKRLDIQGRSKMNKSQLRLAIARREGERS